MNWYNTHRAIYNFFYYTVNIHLKGHDGIDDLALIAESSLWTCLITEPKSWFSYKGTSLYSSKIFTQCLISECPYTRITHYKGISFWVVIYGITLLRNKCFNLAYLVLNIIILLCYIDKFLNGTIYKKVWSFYFNF